MSERKNPPTPSAGVCQEKSLQRSEKFSRTWEDIKFNSAKHKIQKVNESRGRDLLPGIDVAYSNSPREGRNATEQSQKRTTTEVTSCSKSTQKEIIPRVCRKDDGVSRELDCALMTPKEAYCHIENGTASDDRSLFHRNKRIQALGNAVTPQQAYVCFHILLSLISK